MSLPFQRTEIFVTTTTQPTVSVVSLTIVWKLIYDLLHHSVVGSLPLPPSNMPTWKSLEEQAENQLQKK
jgi:hypothetical protein